MTTPSEKEKLNQLLEEIEKHKPWQWEASIWKTEAAYWSWVRSQFRSIWSDWPAKNDYLNKAAIQIPVLDKDGNPCIIKTGVNKGKLKTVKGYKCEATGKLIKASKPKGQRWANYNVDHIESAGSCTNGLEAVIYFFRLLTSQDNMQILDTEHHKILTHMEKKGFATFEEAKFDKELISKTNQKIPVQKKELLEAGFTEEDISNNDKRRECYRKLLTGEKND